MPRQLIMQTQSKREHFLIQGCTTILPSVLIQTLKTKRNQTENSNKINWALFLLKKHGANEDDTNFSLDENFSTLI